MRHSKSPAAALRVRRMMISAVLLLSALHVLGADVLYLRAPDGGWDSGASAADRLRLVSDDGNCRVYNWTGMLPQSFVIADADYSVCLGSTEAVPVNGTEPSALRPLEPRSDSGLITPTGKTDRNAEDLVAVIERGGQWEIKIMPPLYVMDYDDAVPSNNNSPFTASFEGTRNIYSWTGSLTGNFRILKANYGVAYNTARNSPSSSVSRPIAMGSVYYLGTKSTGSISLAEDMFDAIRLTVTHDTATGQAVLETSEPQSQTQTGYCILSDTGEITLMSAGAGEDLFSARLPEAPSGFVIASFRGDGGAEPGAADLTGYYTNGGGVTYYYDELLDYCGGGLPEGGAIRYMTLAEAGADWGPRDFTFDAGACTLRVSGETACVHIPVYFLNEAGFASPHIRAVSAGGRCYTSPEGSAMHRKECGLYGADPAFWRFDLWVPASELSAAADAERARRAPLSAEGGQHDSPLITPATAGSRAPSSLHLTFSDGRSADAAPQFANAPLVPGGVYALSEPAAGWGSPLSEIYLIISGGGAVSRTAVLRQDLRGAHVFRGEIVTAPSSASGETVSFHVATGMQDGLGTGTLYGAPAGTGAAQIAAALSSEAGGRDFSGPMEEDSDRDWEIDFSMIRPAAPAGASVDVAVEISPDGTRSISFGYTPQDFETSACAPEAAQTAPQWLSPQGMTLNGPRRGLCIRLENGKASKVMVR